MSDLVPLDRLTDILDGLRIERISSGLRVPLSYAEFRSEALLKIHLLPYLVPLKSERTLAFELAERPELQKAVGLVENSFPTRPTLWHFRQPSKFPLFRTLMIRALAVMAYEASRSGLPLPFIADDCKDMGISCVETFIDLDSGTDITVRTHPHVQRSPQLSPNLPLPGFDETLLANDKLWLYEWLDFPVEVGWNSDYRLVTRQLKQPSWLESPYEGRDLDQYFGKSSKAPYTACNVLLIRRTDGQDEVLLSQRLRGSGMGHYALPGGKKHEDESLEACVRRELHEELGIDYRAGRPVSLRYTNVPGYPRVRSIGVQATEWFGQPARKEHLAHSEWRWYRFSDLPSPMFFPSQTVIDDFLNRRFEDLDWRTIEPEPPLALWSGYQ